MGAGRRTILRALLVPAVAILLALTGIIPAGAAVEKNVGKRCREYLGPGEDHHSTVCVWMNVDHTNNRIRPYAQINDATGSDGEFGRTVAVQYLRLQKQGDDLAWRDVPGTMVTDLDGWFEIYEGATGVLWSCQGPGSYRALVHYKHQEIWSQEYGKGDLGSGPYSYGQVYNC